MVRTFSPLLALVVLGGILPKVQAQAPPVPLESPPGESKSAYGWIDPLWQFPRPPDAPASLMKPTSATPLYGCAPLPEPYFVQDPLLDPPDFPHPGWVIRAEIDAVGPHVKGVLSGMVQVPNAAMPDTVSLPTASLRWTAAPALQIGYRLPSGFGEFALGYRGLYSSGNDTTAGMDCTSFLHSQLNVTQIDFDYLSREFSLLPHWNMKWHVGVRLAYVYFDGQALEPIDVAAAGSTIFEQRFSNSYWGIGPHAGVELQRTFGGSGVSFITGLDLATLLGRVKQGFFETSTMQDDNGQLLTGENVMSGSQDVPVVNFQAGIAWQPPEFPQAQLFVGYTYEYWWNVGRLSNAGTSAQLIDQGVAVRLAINY